METTRIEGAKIAKELHKQYKDNVLKLKQVGITPKLVVITLGEDPASQVYVGQKNKKAEEIGIEFDWIKLPETTSEEVLKALIDEKNEDTNVNGILVQFPIPNHLSQDKVCSWIDPMKDVDGLHPDNLGLLVRNQAQLYPCTPRGIMHLLDHYQIDLKGKNACMIGRSQIVGFPMGILMINHGATVSMCHSHTVHLKGYTLDADIIVIATGKPNLLTADMVKEGATVIDVGINRLADGSLIGDADYHQLLNKVKYITPVPGGVGPMTVAMLMEQTIIATCIQHQIDPLSILGGS